MWVARKQYLERERLRRAPNRALPASVQRSDRALPQLIVLVQQPSNGFLFAETSIMQSKQRAAERAERFVPRHELGWNVQHAVDTHRSKIMIRNHAAQATRRNLPALNEFGNGQIHSVGGQKFRHAHQPNCSGRRAATSASPKLNRIGA